ncbi:MAG TPA: sigma-70 family RNA polymerase sigma factor [Flavipsychrobacter sp.]|nr:sigma-70 family RNA polymerase sigma factor [Flavipsychrobacter sp.]
MSVPVVHSELSDKEIVERILGGEGRCYEQLIRKYNARLYRIARSIVIDDNDVEELMQCAYIKAYENLAKFHWRSSFPTWLVRILVNECFAFLKRKNRYVSIDDDQKTFSNMTTVTPAAIVLNKELAVALENALFDIQEKYRTVFVMREIEDMSIAETAQALDLTESNVKVRLNRAKTMLQQRLNDYYKSDAVFSFHLTRCDRVVVGVFAAVGCEDSPP